MKIKERQEIRDRAEYLTSQDAHYMTLENSEVVNLLDTLDEAVRLLEEMGRVTGSHDLESSAWETRKQVKVFLKDHGRK